MRNLWHSNRFFQTGRMVSGDSTLMANKDRHGKSCFPFPSCYHIVQEFPQNMLATIKSFVSFVRYQVSKPEMELHMINIIYAALP